MATYIKHLEDVYNVLVRFKIEDPVIRTAAFLHDAIEDGAASYGKIERKFGKDVAELAYAVTDELGRNRRERHAKTFPKIKNDMRALILKLADRIANIEYGRSKNAVNSLFDMYKKEYRTFKKELNGNPSDFSQLQEVDGLKEKLQQMWFYLDSLFSYKP